MPEPGSTNDPNPSPEARARSRALRLLAHRERPRRGVERLLSRAGFSRSVVAPILDELEARGLLSDLRFARLYLSSQGRARPRSRRLLQRDLQRAGVDRATAERALAEAGPEFSEEALAAAAARNKLRTAASDPAKLSRLLRARGFSPGVVRRTLTDLIGTVPAEERRGRRGSGSDRDARDEDA